MQPARETALAASSRAASAARDDLNRHTDMSRKGHNR